jgi:hypothetical protein
MKSPAATAIYTLDAKHQGQVLAHCITRAAFLRHVAADIRTGDLFAWWGHRTGLDAVLDELSGRLDAAARLAGVAHRSDLHGNETAFNSIPLDEHERLGRLQRQVDSLLAQTQAQRAKDVTGFICGVLYDDTKDSVPIRAWLGSDLLTIFDARVTGRIWGEVVRLSVPTSPTLNAVPKGQRPKLHGEHLERDAGWYYRAEVGDPTVTHADLAREYREASVVPLVPKDYAAGIRERADTQLVRTGILKAERLLQLPIPPEQWPQFLANSGLTVGEKLH